MPQKSYELDNIKMREAKVDVENGSHAARKSSTLSFHDIQYEVFSKEGCCGGCKEGSKRKILHDVSGIMKPGLSAIMGPTGSGKSSLLDILAGRKDPSGLSGTVLLDAQPIPDNWKNISGYVVQSDVVLGTLTVRENFWFSANLRLPRSVKKEEKRKKVESVLTELGLTACADTKVGTELIRGVSGGEKKRTNIGMELITSPGVLFLDEPTTGLDASTANAVMNLLKRLANRGRIIICSIHQPRYSIYKLFDSLTLLCLGRVSYHGPATQALGYFKTQGYECEEHNNPADFFLDVINGDSTAIKADEDNVNAIDQQGASTQDIGNTQTTSERLWGLFQQSETYKENINELRTIEKQYNTSIDAKVESGPMYSTSFFYQLYILSDRAFKNVIRNPLASVGNLVLNLIIGVVFGLLYLQVDDSFAPGVQNRLGVLFFITTNLLFGSISTLEIFVKERDIFLHEYVSGYYRIIAYFLAKLFADLIPMRTIAPIIFCSVTYWMVGLKADAGAFFFFLLVVLLTAYSAVSIGLFFSASFDTFGVASLFLSLVFVFSIIFSGLLVNLESITPVLRWLQYLSIARYSFSALCINELSGEYYWTCTNHTTPTGVNDTCYVYGNNILENNLSITYDNAWDLWQNVFALGIIAFGMLCLTYIQLTRLKTLT